MTSNEFDFILEDRIAKIQAINKQYDLEQNAYISFSGGKDSVVLSYLIDLALPNNTIPRAFMNTGIEYNDIVKFVKNIASIDDRFIVLNSNVNLRKLWRDYGYPFKSKEHSLRVEYFNKGTNANYVKKYISGYDKNGFASKFVCPKILQYQFEEKGKYNYSNKCCYKLKKEPMHQWAKANNKTITLTGMRKSEGGNRERLGCTIFLKDKLVKFHPLIVVDDKWENEFVKKYNIKLCELYYPPFNFKRTGCKGCPFALTLQEQLLAMKKLLPNEYKQCLSLWKPVYDEYVRLGYRLDKDFYTKQTQYTIDDFIEKDKELEND